MTRHFVTYPHFTVQLQNSAYIQASHDWDRDRAMLVLSKCNIKIDVDEQLADKNLIM